MNRFLIVIEVLAFAVALVFVLFWIGDPSGPYEPVFALCGLVGVGLELVRRCKTVKVKQRNAPTPYIDKKSRVFFNNGWDGFDMDTDRDVVFRLPLAAPRDFLRHIELMRPYKVEAYNASEHVISVAPKKLDYLYEANATISLCVGSSKTGRHSEPTYNDFFFRYKPQIPGNVQLHVLDGSGEALWEWQAGVPSSWLIDKHPFVSQDGRNELAEMLDSWLWAHDAEVRRLRGEVSSA